MTTRTYVKTLLIVALVVSAMGGFLLHFRVHSPLEHSFGIVPYVAGILSVLLVPILLSFRRTLDYGYILNGMLVIVGTVTMTHFAIDHWPTPFSIGGLLFKTTLADILILGTKFFVGKAIFDLELHGYDPNRPKEGIWWRYPNLGWWWIHFAAISVVYGLGYFFWR
ncbi:MAG: hypothetical protein C0404_00615 [Verrucomicrobia bacterium]|nr:hypothetical protein [Verrucomicrobiota bacterium]